MNQGKPVLLAIFDLSAAFDIVDHNCTFLGWKTGFVWIILQYFRLYLEQISQRVSVHGILSDAHFIVL